MSTLINEISSINVTGFSAINDVSGFTIKSDASIKLEESITKGNSKITIESKDNFSFSLDLIIKDDGTLAGSNLITTSTKPSMFIEKVTKIKNQYSDEIEKIDSDIAEITEQIIVMQDEIYQLQQELNSSIYDQTKRAKQLKIDEKTNKITSLNNSINELTQTKQSKSNNVQYIEAQNNVVDIINKITTYLIDSSNPNNVVKFTQISP